MKKYLIPIVGLCSLIGVVLSNDYLLIYLRLLFLNENDPAADAAQDIESNRPRCYVISSVVPIIPGADDEGETAFCSQKATFFYGTSDYQIGNMRFDANERARIYALKYNEYVLKNAIK